jgi:small subunit ribosomal protein S17
VSNRNFRKTKIGKVVRLSNEKSVSVLVERLIRHKLYGKVTKLSKKYRAHDESSISKLGDKVLIMECRPISKTKRWRIVEIIGDTKASAVRSEK